MLLDSGYNICQGFILFETDALALFPCFIARPPLNYIFIFEVADISNSP
jgi:hypothetical protein